MEDNPYRPSPSVLDGPAAEPAPADALQSASTPRWFTRTLATLGIGGGAIGLVIIAWLFLSSPLSLAHLIFAPAIAGYTFGVYCGVAALRRTPGYLNRNAWFYWLQVPVLSSPALVYSFVSGAQVAVGLAPPRLVWYFHVGSTFNLFVGSEAPLAAGVNLVAVVMLGLIHRMKKLA